MNKLKISTETCTKHTQQQAIRKTVTFPVTLPAFAFIQGECIATLVGITGHLHEGDGVQSSCRCVEVCLDASSSQRLDSRSYRCIIQSINDPNVFLLDHLLVLEPVKILEGETVHKVSREAPKAPMIDQFVF